MRSFEIYEQAACSTSGSARQAITARRRAVAAQTGVTTLLVLVGAIVFVWEAKAEAYLDPGSGSMLIQLLLGGVAGLVVIMKLFWRRILDFFGVASDDKPERSGDA